VQLIDLGLQPQRAFQGKDKAPAQEIMLTYELVDEFMKDEDGNDIEEKPRWISETLPFYGLVADKAKSTKRYNALDPNGAYDGDFSKCLDTPVTVTVVHNPNAKDPENPYQNIGNIAPMRPRDAANCPELKNPIKVFDLDEPDMETFNALPEWIREKIKGNLNFKGSALEKALGGTQKETAKGDDKKAKDRKPAAPVEEDDNPF
jgi:hypothetical protein